MNRTFFSLAAQASLQCSNTGFGEDEILQWPVLALSAKGAVRNTSEHRGFSVNSRFAFYKVSALVLVAAVAHYQPIFASLHPWYSVFHIC